VGVSF